MRCVVPVSPARVVRWFVTLGLGGLLFTPFEPAYGQVVTTTLPATYVLQGDDEVGLTDLTAQVTVTSPATTYLVLLELDVTNTTTQDVQLVRRLAQDGVTMRSETITASPGCPTPPACPTARRPGRCS
jgi:hypothetical protein